MIFIFKGLRTGLRDYFSRNVLAWNMSATAWSLRVLQARENKQVENQQAQHHKYVHFLFR